MLFCTAKFVTWCIRLYIIHGWQLRYHCIFSLYEGPVADQKLFLKKRVVFTEDAKDLPPSPKDLFCDSPTGSKQHIYLSMTLQAPFDLLDIMVQVAEHIA